ncbi:hypothetical protein NHQ30_007163 [Ciborinia camelliae]|nr:hypothetical protein NHQ30_007163 [Ciborinia camelliae]
MPLFRKNTGAESNAPPGSENGRAGPSAFESGQVLRKPGNMPASQTNTRAGLEGPGKNYEPTAAFSMDPEPSAYEFETKLGKEENMTASRVNLRARLEAPPGNQEQHAASSGSVYPQDQQVSQTNTRAKVEARPSNEQQNAGLNPSKSQQVKRKLLPEDNKAIRPAQHQVIVTNQSRPNDMSESLIVQKYDTNPQPASKAARPDIQPRTPGQSRFTEIFSQEDVVDDGHKPNPCLTRSDGYGGGNLSAFKSQHKVDTSHQNGQNAMSNSFIARDNDMNLRLASKPPPLENLRERRGHERFPNLDFSKINKLESSIAQEHAMNPRLAKKPLRPDNLPPQQEIDRISETRAPKNAITVLPIARKYATNPQPNMQQPPKQGESRFKESDMDYIKEPGEFLPRLDGDGKGGFISPRYLNGPPFRQNGVMKTSNPNGLLERFEVSPEDVLQQGIIYSKQRAVEYSGRKPVPKSFEERPNQSNLTNSQPPNLSQHHSTFQSSTYRAQDPQRSQGKLQKRHPNQLANSGNPQALRDSNTSEINPHPHGNSELCEKGVVPVSNMELFYYNS